MNNQYSAPKEDSRCICAVKSILFTTSRLSSATPQRHCVFDSQPVCADWIHGAVAGWRGPNLTETPDLVPFDQPQQGVLLQLRVAEQEAEQEGRGSQEERLQG